MPIPLIALGALAIVGAITALLVLNFFSKLRTVVPTNISPRPTAKTGPAGNVYYRWPSMLEGLAETPAGAAVLGAAVRRNGADLPAEDQ